MGICGSSQKEPIIRSYARNEVDAVGIGDGLCNYVYDVGVGSGDVSMKPMSTFASESTLQFTKERINKKPRAQKTNEIAMDILHIMASGSMEKIPKKGRKKLVLKDDDLSRFGRKLIQLADRVRDVFTSETKLLHLRSPTYVLGDLHGNFEDLAWYEKNIWPLGPRLTGGQFLFLGDFVDRGPNSLCVVAYLFAHKILSPKKWFLIRGNHETREVNGRKHGITLKNGCHKAFGVAQGDKVWAALNNAFDCLPIAAFIDGDFGRTFCAHGGIPRKCSTRDRVDDISHMEKQIIDPDNLEDASNLVGHEGALSSEQINMWFNWQMLLDCTWADPATEAQEELLDKDGFAERDDGAANSDEQPRYLSFGRRAVDEFCAEYRVNFILRGHQSKSEGIEVSKNGKVITIFSDSAHDNDGPGRCGCALVDNDAVRLIQGGPVSQGIPPRTASSSNSSKEHSTNTASKDPLPTINEADEENRN